MYAKDRRRGNRNGILYLMYCMYMYILIGYESHEDKDDVESPPPVYIYCGICTSCVFAQQGNSMEYEVAAALSAHQASTRASACHTACCALLARLILVAAVIMLGKGQPSRVAYLVKLIIIKSRTAVAMQHQQRRRRLQ